MSSSPRQKGTPRAGTLAEGAHFALVLVLVVLLAALLCYASTRRFVRMDWRSAARQPLTRDTRNLLARVNQDVQATIVFRTLYFPDDKQWMRTLQMARQVLQRFHNVNPRISVDELNWSLPANQARLREIARRTGEENLPVVCVLFRAAGGHQVVSFDDLVYQSSGPFAPPDAFLGESVFARTLARLTGLQAPALAPLSGARKMQSMELAPGHVTAARYVFVAGLPACFVALGFVVYLMRRR